jgi:hypothetical protein
VLYFILKLVGVYLVFVVTISFSRFNAYNNKKTRKGAKIIEVYSLLARFNSWTEPKARQLGKGTLQDAAGAPTLFSNSTQELFVSTMQCGYLIHPEKTVLRS